MGSESDFVGSGIVRNSGERNPTLTPFIHFFNRVRNLDA